MEKTACPSRHGHLSKLTDQASRALIRETTNEPMLTVEELHLSIALVGEFIDRTTLGCPNLGHNEREGVQFTTG